MQSSQSIQMMGTTIDIAIHAHNSSELMNKVIELLHVYNKRFSANDTSSELMHVNQNAGIKPVAVHDELFELIAIGKKESLSTIGHFDMTIGPVVKCWKIGFKDANVPDVKQIEQALQKVNAQKVQLDEATHTVFLEEPGMEIDLGALAKGYIADKIMAFLKQENVNSALINLGGNVLVYGNNPKRQTGEWLIGLQNPKAKRHEHLGLIRVMNQSVVTSGIYERKLEVNGQKFHHIFDTKTGFPIQSDMASITIVAKESVVCEIWTSQLFGLPIQQALAIIDSQNDIEGVIVSNDNAIYLSQGIKPSFIALEN